MKSWSGKAQAYRDSFASGCEGTIDLLLDAVGAAAGARLLDAGCGTGTLLARALERGSDAIGVDADPDMVAIASTVARGRVAEAALPSLPFADAELGCVTANFVINHVPDPRSAMHEIARVAAPGGRVAVTVWPAGGNGWGDLIGGALEAGGAVPIPSTRLPQHLDFDRTPDGLAAVAREAGLTVTAAQEVTWTWRVAPRALWTGIAGGIGTPGLTYLAQAPAVRDAVRRTFDERAGALADEDGMLALTNRAVLVAATR